MTTPTTPAINRQFVWTLIPAGRVASVGGQAMALSSLLVTPRLLGPAGQPHKLSDFNMQAWPQRLAAATFSARRGGSPLAPATQIRRVPYVGLDGSQIRFGPPAAQPEPGARLIAVADQLKAWTTIFPPDMPVVPYQPTSYTDRDHVEFPAREAGAQINSAYSGSSQVLATADHTDTTGLRTALLAVNAPWRAQLLSQDPSGNDDPPPLQRAYDFYHRPQNQTTAAAPGDDTGIEDFHYTVSRLADHPLLLRTLGLLIDLAVPVTGLQGPGDTTLQIAVGWPDPDPTQEDLTPATAYVLDVARFVPAGATGAQAAPFALGMLALDGAAPAGEGTNGRFEIMPFDVDGAALRMYSSAQSGNGQPASDHPDDPGLPALRSAGFALLDTQRITEHNNRIQRAEDRKTTDGLLGTPLTAENLISGYRLDILDHNTGQWRSVCRRRVHYAIGNVEIGTDAVGELEEGCVRIDSVTTGADADDPLYVHQIVARWDGWSLVGSRPDRIANPAAIPSSLPFTVHQGHDPGSLPRLRFGRTYQLRLRLADLAGGGLQPDEPGSLEQQTAAFTHRRFEPIPAPELLPTRPYVDGEGQGQLVIRSDRGISAADYAAAHGYHADDLRLLFAPKAALELAIQHGRFDAALGASGAANSDGLFKSTAIRADRDLADIAGAKTQPEAGGPDAYYIVPETGADMPWLPDPAAPLFALGLRSRPTDPKTGVPGTATGFDAPDPAAPTQMLHIQYKWLGSWPAYAPTRLQLNAGDSGCVAKLVTTASARTFTIALGPAEQATLDLVSCPAQADVPALGVGLWAGANPLDPSDAVFKRVYHGHIRTVTPPHTITVVHAVQRPLMDPQGGFVGSRQTGDTDAVLRTTDFKFDPASTGRIDVHADWSEFNDIVTDPPTPPTTQQFSCHVGSYDVAYAASDKALPILTQQFGDTRRRRVTHSVTAISRYRDYFATITAADPQACTVSAVLDPQTDIPSSARAPAPHLRYTLPAFGWSRTGGHGAAYQSTRRGGGVRVLLERPWYASGEDEMLAVIVSAGSSGPHISMAGADPIWTTNAPHTPLTAQDVVSPEPTPNRVALPEEDFPVVPMLYPVTFDADLNCWVADLDLSPLADTSYFAFVRLALCRYQPNTSVDVPQLSPPVETEPLQLFPSRSLTVTPAPGNLTAVLSGIGGGSTSNVVHAELQVAGTAGATDDALIGAPGWTTIATASGALGAQLHINIPAAETRPTRLLVTETESYPSPNPAPGTATSRIIYADTVALT